MIRLSDSSLVTRMARAAALVVIVVAATLGRAPVAEAQNPTPTPPFPPLFRRATEIVRGMTVQQKVGQLFLVSYVGADASSSSDIADLVANYKVGGVLLKASNQNFQNGRDGAHQLAKLTADLQSLAGIGASTALTVGLSSAGTVTRAAPAFIPMFIALSQEGDGAPFSEVTQGVLAGPSALSLGASWRPEHAEAIGRIVGSELADLGVNLLLGPNLDVADASRPPTTADSLTRVFGGDPYWVGRFGAAYTRGVHVGGRNRVAVVAKSFPGLGSADRVVEEEIPTVQKSLEQLKQIELAPFFAVTQLEGKVSGGIITGTDIVDGLLVSHIRYRGFQGNIRASTRPVSFDPQAYQDLMGLPEIAPWRAAGGLTVSDALGVRSVRRFYDPLETSFNARQVAREAFLAGNDVLNLGAFALTASWPEQLANIKDTINFFRERYVSEPAFAARVDSAASRIVAVKLKQYQNNLESSNILNPPAATASATPAVNVTPAPSALASGRDLLAAIARDSLTLLSPSPRDLPSILPGPPSKGDSIVIITDDREIRECARCAPYRAIERSALEEIVIRLYGPQTTGQVSPASVTSFDFTELAAYGGRASSLVTQTATPRPPTATVTDTAVVTPTVENTVPRIQTAIDGANWIVIAMTDLSPSLRSTRVFREFLAQRADALRDKRVVAYAFGSPTHLDLTEISKLTSYIGVFSRTPASLEAAMKSLFGEFGFAGASPVSIPALNYSLTEQTAPDPARDIPLFAGEAITRPAGTAGALSLRIGDRLRLRAGPILDRNGRIVPDNTPVQFLLSYPSERVEQQPLQGLTRDGFADAVMAIERKGSLFIRALADRANRSYIVRVDIGDTTASIETLRPTPLPTSTAEPSPTPVTVRPTVEIVVTPTPPPTPPPPPSRASLPGFALALAGLLAALGATVSALRLRAPTAQRGLQIRLLALAWTAAWAAYVALATGTFGQAPLGIAPPWLAASAIAVVVGGASLMATALLVLRKR